MPVTSTPSSTSVQWIEGIEHIKIGMLSGNYSPRTAGLVPGYAAQLAEILDELPPIMVQRIIDARSRRGTSAGGGKVARRPDGARRLLRRR